VDEEMSNELLRSVGFSFNGADENYRERERSLSGQNRKHGVEERYQTRRRDRYHQARLKIIRKKLDLNIPVIKGRGLKKLSNTKKLGKIHGSY